MKVQRTGTQSLWAAARAARVRGCTLQGTNLDHVDRSAIERAVAANADFVLLDVEKGVDSAGQRPTAKHVELCLAAARSAHVPILVRVGRQVCPEMVDACALADGVMVSEVSAAQHVPEGMSAPAIAVIESRSAVANIPALVDSGLFRAFCIGPDDLATDLEVVDPTASDLLRETVSSAVRDLAIRGQTVMMPLRPGFDISELREAGVGIFVARQQPTAHQSRPGGQ